MITLDSYEAFTKQHIFERMGLADDVLNLAHEVVWGWSGVELDAFVRKFMGAPRTVKVLRIPIPEGVDSFGSATLVVSLAGSHLAPSNRSFRNIYTSKPDFFVGGLFTPDADDLDVNIRVSADRAALKDAEVEPMVKELKQAIFSALCHELTHAYEEGKRRKHSNGKFGITNTKNLDLLLTTTSSLTFKEALEQLSPLAKHRIEKALVAKKLNPAVEKRADKLFARVWFCLYLAVGMEQRARIAEQQALNLTGKTREERLANLKDSEQWEALRRMESLDLSAILAKVPEDKQIAVLDVLKYKILLVTEGLIEMHRSSGEAELTEYYKQLNSVFKPSSPLSIVTMLTRLVKKAATEHRRDLLRSLAYEDPGPTVRAPFGKPTAKPYPTFGIPSHDRAIQAV